MSYIITSTVEEEDYDSKRSNLLNEENEDITRIQTEVAYIEKVRDFINSDPGQYLITYLSHIKNNKLEELINETDSNNFKHIQSDIKALQYFVEVILSMQEKEESLRIQLEQIKEELSY